MHKVNPVDLLVFVIVEWLGWSGCCIPEECAFFFGEDLSIWSIEYWIITVFLTRWLFSMNGI